MSKYAALTDHLFWLERDGDTEWRASFSDVEEVLGDDLPPSALQHRPWWANQGRAHSLAWENAGWKTTNVDLANRTVTFVRSDGDDEPEIPEVTKLSIAEAKAGLAANFNVSVDAVEITIRA